MNEDQPTARETTIADQIRNGTLGANDIEYVEGEMVREPFGSEPVMTETVPGAEVLDRSAMGKIPEQKHTTQEDTVTHHAEDVAMHDAEIRSQNSPIVVES